jgi:hypothetical protein
MEFLHEYFPQVEGLWLSILFFGVLPVIGIVLGVAVFMGLGFLADGSSSRRVKRAAVVVLLLVIGGAVAFIVYYVMNNWRR